jgi:hypothetical protein
MKIVQVKFGFVTIFRDTMDISIIHFTKDLTAISSIGVQMKCHYQTNAGVCQLYASSLYSTAQLGKNFIWDILIIL